MTEKNEAHDAEWKDVEPFSGLPDQFKQAQWDGSTAMQTKTPYTTAVAVMKPRSMARFTKNVLDEAKLAGAGFYYGWTQAGKLIEGAAISCAMSMFRNYQNAAIELDVQETGTHYIFKATFIDLETGATAPRLYRQRKGQKVGKHDSERAEDMVFQIGQSKAVRNAILRMMPDWLVEQAIAAAKQAEIERIKTESPAIARVKVLDYFGRYGIDQERMEAKIGRVIDKWTEKDIVDLRGMASAIKEGRVSVDELFPTSTSKPPAEPTTQQPKTKPASSPTGSADTPEVRRATQDAVLNGAPVKTAGIASGTLQSLYAKLNAWGDRGAAVAKPYLDKLSRPELVYLREEEGQELMKALDALNDPKPREESKALDEFYTACEAGGLTESHVEAWFVGQGADTSDKQELIVAEVFETEAMFQAWLKAEVDKPSQ